jgi:hypothetical protein
MSIHAEHIKDLALYAPRVAYGLIVGVPRIPVVEEIPIQFSASTVNAPPVVQNLQNNISQDTVIERISFNLFQQNSFPGSPLSSLYFNMLKQSGATGVGIQMQIFGGPKWVLSSQFIDLGNLADVFAVAWPNGLPLPKQSNVKVSAILTQTPVSVPYNIVITFLGWQMLDKQISDLSDQEARARLRKLGIESPDLAILLNP